jgi:hypothetical protein
MRAMRQQGQPLDVRHSHSLGDLPQALGVGGAQAADHCTNSRTVYCLPVAMTKSSACAC